MLKDIFVSLLLLLSILQQTVGGPLELTRREDVTSLFEENRAVIQAAAESGDFTEAAKIHGIQEIDQQEDGGCIDFYCGGKGFGPETAYYGFFYSPTDDMTALDGCTCSPEDLTPSGSGFCWQESGTDNTYYVEPLGNHFFYYCLEF